MNEFHKLSINGLHVLIRGDEFTRLGRWQGGSTNCHSFGAEF